MATSSPTMSVTTPSDREMVVTREFDAPRALVFEAWTKAEHFTKWIGPRDVVTISCEMDVRAGGNYRFVQRSADGNLHAFHGVYREVEPPHRLVSTFIYEGAPETEILNSLELEERGGKTTATITSQFPSAAVLDAMTESGMQRGMREGFERLEELLAFDIPTQPILTIEREFDAPRDLVYKCWTDPEHFARWFGPQGFTVPHCSIDLRPGGITHFAMASPDGREFWSKGIFREIVPNERLLSWVYFSDAQGSFVDPKTYGIVEGFPSHILQLITFEDVNGKTKVTIKQSYPATIAERQGAYTGWNMSLDKLTAYLEQAQ